MKEDMYKSNDQKVIARRYLLVLVTPLARGGLGQHHRFEFAA